MSRVGEIRSAWLCDVGKRRHREDIVCAIRNGGINDNHSIAYCLLGYLCAYYRYYHPIEFITSFLNNAANEEDIRNGTAYAERVGIKVTMPKWGLSKSQYFFDKERNVIAKGVTSIKYMSGGLAEELYNIAHSKKYEYFVDVLREIGKTSLNARQLDILIKLDFFSEFGNQRELFRIWEFFNNIFKEGEAKQISKSKIEGSPLESIVQKYSTDVTKSGAKAKNYTLTDIRSALIETEQSIKSAGLSDLSITLKVKNFADVMGYVGYVSGKEEDRKKLYVMNTYPLVRKKDGKQFGYSVITKSIGSGVEARFTVFNRVFDNEPIEKGDIIICKSWERDGQYFRMTGYEKIY